MSRLVHTSARIDEADLNLIGKTSLPEVAELIRGAVLHIDNEGGLVHLARAMGTVSCVVFGPTSSRYFGYAANINIDPTFCGGCWWINETWMNHCPRGFATARCMTEQPASAVADAADRFLRTRPSIQQPLENPGASAGNSKINPSAPAGCHDCGFGDPRLNSAQKDWSHLPPLATNGP